MAEVKAGHGKKKGTTVPLTTFLRPETSDWADEDVENEIAPPLPTAPGQSAGRSYQQPMSPSIADSELPDEPPYKAFVGNLVHEIRPDDIGEFFSSSMQVVEVFILRHADTQNVKGAFLELATREDLVKALQLNGQFLLGRPMRINVATGARRRPDSHMGMDSRRGGSGGLDRRSMGYGDRGYDRHGGFEDRRGGFNDRGPRAGGFYDRPDRFDDRRGGFHDRGPEPYRSEEEETKTWGHKHFVPSSPRRAPAPPPPQAPAEPAQPVQRKKLVLAPRTIKPGEEPVQATASSENPSKANPFGSAKPVDAQAALRRIEEKIEKEKAEKKEAAQREKDERIRQELEARRAQEEAQASAAPPQGLNVGNGAVPAGYSSHHQMPRGPPQGAGSMPDIGPPPGMGTRGGYQGGERGRGRGRGPARGRGRGEFGGRGDLEGRGRGPPGEFRGPGPESRGKEFTQIIKNPSNNRPPNDQGFQEASSNRPARRGWETKAPPGMQIAAPSAEQAPSKTTNLFAALSMEEE